MKDYFKILGMTLIFINTIFALNIVLAQTYNLKPQQASKDSLQLHETPKAKDTKTVSHQPAPAPQPLDLRKTGVVRVTRDNYGQVTAIKVGDVYISLNEGSKLLENLDGWKVCMTGTLNIKDDKRIFYVKQVKRIQRVQTNEVNNSVEPVQSNRVVSAKPVQKASDILILDSWELLNTQNVFFVTGTIHTTAEVAYNVEIHLGLYNENKEKISNVSAKTETLNLKELWRFKINLPNDFFYIKPVLLKGAWLSYDVNQQKVGNKTVYKYDQKSDSIECPLNYDLVPKNPTVVKDNK